MYSDITVHEQQGQNVISRVRIREFVPLLIRVVGLNYFRKGYNCNDKIDLFRV